MVAFPTQTGKTLSGAGLRPSLAAVRRPLAFGAEKPLGTLPTTPVEAPTPRLIDDDVYNLIRGLPKASLHEHLAGCTDMALYKMDFLAEGQRVGLDAETLRNRLRIARAKQYQKTINTTDLHDEGPPVAAGQKDGLENYRKKYAENNSYLKTKMIENAYMASYLYTLRAARENVRYFELRTNPTPGNGKPEELIKFIQEGIEDAKSELSKGRQKVDYGIILLAYRHGDETVNPETGRKVKVDKAVDVAKQAIQLRKKGYPVSGIDLAGNEMDNAPTEFAPMFDLIKKHNALMVKQGKPKLRIGITVHAGETPNSGPLSGAESVREAIRLAWDENTPVRIGHGIFSRNDASLLEEMKQKGIGIEMCPKSNVQTEAVNWYTDHPAPDLARQGLKISISSDNQTVSKSDATNELVKLFKYRQVTHEDRKRMVMNALETAFIMDPEKKARLIQETRDNFEHLEAKPKMALALFKEEQILGHKPKLTFKVYDGLLQHAEHRQRVDNAPLDMRRDLSSLLGRPVTPLEFLPFQLRTWLHRMTENVVTALQKLTEKLSAQALEAGPAPAQ